MSSRVDSSSHEPGRAPESTCRGHHRAAAPTTPVAALLVLVLAGCDTGGLTPQRSVTPQAQLPSPAASIAPQAQLPSPSVSVTPTPGPTAPPCTSPDSLGCFAEAVEASASRGKFSGVVLVADHREPIWHQAYGEKVSLDTPEDVASVTKMFTGVAIAQVVEAGKLSYKDKVGSYVRDLPADIGRATIGQLASHTAGVGFQALGSGLVYEPGVFHYSNAGFNLLARVVEEVTDQKFADYLQQSIFEPAGMQATSFAYSSSRGTPDGAGGVLSTAGDLLRFANALYAYQLLDAETTTLVTTPKVTFESGAYGYGFGIFGLDDEVPSVGHVGALAPVNVVAAVEINPTLGHTIIIVCEHGFEDIEPELITYQVAINMGYFRG
jgi:CubicO group peptidase (beta-lactamase class C family)